MKTAKRIRVYVRERNGKFQLFWTNPLTGLRKTKTSSAENLADANVEAAVLSHNLTSDIDTKTPTTWQWFRQRFEDERLPSLSPRGRNSYICAMNRFEQIIGDNLTLPEITPSLLSRFQAGLRDGGVADATICNYLRHVQGALKWAERLELIPKCPYVEKPRLIQSQLAKGRPLSEREFGAIIKAIDLVYRSAPNQFRSHLQLIATGLWLSGLRLQEFFRLSWDSPPVLLDLDGGKYPRIIWHAAGHKARRDEITPLTPDFAKWLESTFPKDVRVGNVFPRPVPWDRVSGLIREAASKAGVRSGTNFASPHDFRRSFATRWAQKVRPITLKSLMRHSDIKTTLQYYIGLDADDVGAELWGKPKKPK